MSIQTKIIATVSDERCEVSFIRSLYENGATVVRLNTAHINYDGFKRVVECVRNASPEIGILIDTKGPEVRTTSTIEDKEIYFQKGDKTIFMGNPDGITTHDCICLSYSLIHDEVSVGMHMLLDDGFLDFVVDKVDGNKIYAVAQNDGLLGSRKSVNMPGSDINLPSLTNKDIENIGYAIELGVEYIAHSFVRRPADVIAVRELLLAQNSRIKVIAKIENQEGVDNIDAILDVADGVLIARGDLGVEIPAERIPTIQRMIIDKCNRRHKPVIVSTQMLHSMISNPRPTRAEVSDIANAIYQHADALLLTGETAVGRYPIESVMTMAKIIEEAEKNRTELISSKRYIHESIEEQLEEYILAHIDAEPPLLKKLNRDTHLFHLYPRMCSGHLQGRMLKMFTSMINPKRILELGTFTGYSALCFAEGMSADAELHTIEIDDESEEFITERFDTSPYADRLHLHIGDAIEIIPTIKGKFDLVFIDANKRNYTEYYELVMSRLAVGGFIIADNTLWDGKVVDPQSINDAQTRGILDFNTHVAKDERVQRIIIPLRDGLTIIRKIKD